MYELAHAASGKGQRPMRRETTNAIRTVLEEVLPPFVRDSAAMRWLFRRHWGHLIDDLEDFRARLPFVTPDEYRDVYRSEEHTSELQSLMRISYAVFCLTKKTIHKIITNTKQ